MQFASSPESVGESRLWESSETVKTHFKFSPSTTPLLNCFPARNQFSSSSR